MHVCITPWSLFESAFSLKNNITLTVKREDIHIFMSIYSVNSDVSLHVCVSHMNKFTCFPLCYFVTSFRLFCFFMLPSVITVFVCSQWWTWLYFLVMHQILKHNIEMLSIEESDDNLRDKPCLQLYGNRILFLQIFSGRQYLWFSL